MMVAKKIVLTLLLLIGAPTPLSMITTMHKAVHPQPKRIVISGNCGSGKTTLAQELSQKLNIPIFHLDKYYWKPGWKKRNSKEFMMLHNKLCKKKSWIIEGPYASGLAERCNLADVVVFLDRSPFLCSWRVIKRMITNFRTKRKDLNEGDFYGLGITKVVLKNIWLFEKQHKPRLFNIINKEATKKVRLLTSNKEITNFVQNLST